VRLSTKEFAFQLTSSTHELERARWDAAVGEWLRAIAPAVQYDTRTNGSGTLMRIHRDTRFSNRSSWDYRT